MRISAAQFAALCCVAGGFHASTNTNSSDALDVNTSGTPKRVLMVDIRGPTATTSDGVRTMGMLMDLKSNECKHQVEVLSDSWNVTEMMSSWPKNVSLKEFAGVHVWTPKEFHDRKFDIANFDRIIIGAKLELLYADGNTPGISVPSVVLELERRKLDRNKVEVYWDDVPFDRCKLKPEAETICPRVGLLVKKFSSVARKFFVLSQLDKKEMIRHMQENMLWREDIVIRVWPLRIQNMREILPYTPFSYENVASKDLVTMMGNNHAVNSKVVHELFDSGAITHICSRIKLYQSRVRIMFMGGLSVDAKKARDAHYSTGDMSCVIIAEGSLSQEEWKHQIYPRTRAVLNPFFEKIDSGISAKSFESVMMGVPFITSQYGMHGLSDEFEPCTWFPMPKNPSDTSEFENFVIRNVVDPRGYQQFVEKFKIISSACERAQQAEFPVQRQCR